MHQLPPPGLQPDIEPEIQPRRELRAFSNFYFTIIVVAITMGIVIQHYPDGYKSIQRTVSIGYEYLHSLVFSENGISPCQFNTSDAHRRVKRLKKRLEAELFGQELAADITIKALSSHLLQSNPKKALVLSFHGSVGCGKTHLSQLIAEHLFDGGFDSPYVQHSIGPKDFIDDPTKLAQNKAKLEALLEESTKRCGRALLIFDEVDKMPPKIFDVLVSYIDIHKPKNNVDYRGLVFIFLSNTGAKAINTKTAELLEYKWREDIRNEDFLQLIQHGAFNEEGGLQKAHMINQQLVSHYVPFLPLEQEHVIQCAERDILEKKAALVQPETIASKIIYKPAKPQSVWDRRFAEFGCKGVSELVNIEMRME